jgi:hypothetical protein
MKERHLRRLRQGIFHLVRRRETIRPLGCLRGQQPLLKLYRPIHGGGLSGPKPKSEPYLMAKFESVCIQTSPMATSEPEAATALGSNDGFCSRTLWFDRNASIFPISAMKTVESPATAIDLGCEAVEAEAGLREGWFDSVLRSI